MRGAGGWLAASDAGEVISSLVGAGLAGGLWLLLAFRAFRLRDEGSPRYAGLSRWIGEQIRTPARAITLVAVSVGAVLLVNLLA